jgi:hypothetical protein
MVISMAAYLVTGRCKLGNESGPGKWSAARAIITLRVLGRVNEPESRS